MDSQEKLKVLADAGKYDLACACGTKNKEDHRRRDATGDAWLYPATLASGGKGIMLKTLLSSSCVGDCAYCPMRSSLDSVRRCTLGSDELARLFLEYDRRKKLLGLFVSSGIMRDADYTMLRLNAVAAILRKKYKYKGYIHVKIIPGASDAAIEEAVNLASAVSINIETPTAQQCSLLSRRKDWERDIMRPIRLIQELINKRPGKRRIGQTTQFIVGAAGESDREILEKTVSLYREHEMDRVYFSSYQKSGKGCDLPGDAVDGRDALTREHRLYQSDFLLRQYGFTESDLLYGKDGRLSLSDDPKKCWADAHPEFFPVRARTAERWELLRVPGMGPVTVGRLLRARRETYLRGVEDLGLKGKRGALVATYLDFS